MIKFSLDGQWLFAQNDENWLEGTVPGSLYNDLIKNGKMDDPFWRDNELSACAILENDTTYKRHFKVPSELLSCNRTMLRFEGLDTLCEIILNGKVVAETDNMHRTWEFDVKKYLKLGENELIIVFRSPNKYIAEMREKYGASGVEWQCMEGFSYIRKAHCQFGWDWGPRLPDCGIWRSVSLIGIECGRFESVYIRQKHENGNVTIIAEAKTELVNTENTFVEFTLITPDGETIPFEGNELLVTNPKLWWPNGYGSQPLYTVKAFLFDGSNVIDTWEKKIGLRTMTIRREKDIYGESFEICVNGVSIFAKGGDYIPEDSVFSRMTPERTERIISDCALAGYNSIRVWGGGVYPADWFFDACDKYGLVVWQDCMFACAFYRLVDNFENTIRAEIIDNVRRIRNHASLGLWCGNNEIEQIVQDGEGTPQQRADYVKLFEYIIPNIIKEEDPETFYWPSSPSSGVVFDDCHSPNRGDEHYWAVWHEGKPFTDYRNYLFRFASEFGFQSFPCLETIKTFTTPNDRNIFSYVMEKHQRNFSANGKIMSYIEQTYRYPTTFDNVLYASQLVQADAIRYGVEHWRRHRGQCMGAIYWQINDCWPSASWSSIDYCGRWKALHYAAKRFFAPVLLSCEETTPFTVDSSCNINAEHISKEKKAKFNISNETLNVFNGAIRWALKTTSGKELKNGEMCVSVPALSSVWIDEEDFSEGGWFDSYLSYELLDNTGMLISSSTLLFCPPKYFEFKNPNLTVATFGNTIVVTAEAYAQSVEIVAPDAEFLLDDNFFSMEAGTKTVTILRGNPEGLFIRSVYDIGREEYSSIASHNTEE